MARKLFGTSIALPAPFVAGSCDPVDARLVVETFADLTTNAADTFGTIGSDYCKVYEGIQVYVTSEKATYMFVGQSDANGVLLTSVQSADSWRKLSAKGMSSDDIQDQIDKITVNNTDGSISVVKQEDGTTISVKFDSTDQILTVSNNGIKVNVDLKWDNKTGLQLIGKSGQVIETIPATDFIKDGMLESVTLEENPGGQAAGTYLHFVFNTDATKSDIYLNVTDLIDIYTAGNGITIEDNVVSLKMAADNENEFLTLDGDGLKLSGVRNAITTATQSLQPSIDKIESSVGLATDGSHVITSGHYTSGASTVVGEIAALDIQVKKNADAIAAETARAKEEETRIADEVIGEDQLEEGKTVMDVILENEETAQQAIEKLATSAGLLNGEEIAYTAPTVSGEFSSTTSIMDMLNAIDAKWNVIDCGTY